MSLWGLLALDLLPTGASQFHHGNVNISFGMQDRLERVVVTPRMHRAHHATHGACFAAIIGRETPRSWR